MDVTCVEASLLLLLHRLYELIYDLSCISGQTLCTVAT